VEITKINKRKSHQKRILLVTTKFIYNLKKKGALEKIFGSDLTVRSKFSLVHLEKVLYGKCSKEFVLVFPNIFDLHYSHSERDVILDYIFLSKSIECSLDNNLDFIFIDDKSLTAYCTHPSKKSSKIPKGEGIIMNREEFNVHFLGKPQPNLIPNSSKPIHLKDFEFLKMLGIGGFSKVYLVKKKDSNELYALKSIRLPDKAMMKGDKDKYKEQVRNERDILVSINHPFIVKLKYAFQLGRRFFFVMPFIQYFKNNFVEAEKSLAT